jgi:hypothetical protein
MDTDGTGKHSKGQIVWDAAVHATSADKSVLDEEREKHQNRYASCTFRMYVQHLCIGACLQSSALRCPVQGAGHAERAGAGEQEGTAENSGICDGH